MRGSRSMVAEKHRSSDSVRTGRKRSPASSAQSRMPPPSRRAQPQPRTDGSAEYASTPAVFREGHPDTRVRPSLVHAWPTGAPASHRRRDATGVILRSKRIALLPICAADQAVSAPEFLAHRISIAVRLPARWSGATPQHALDLVVKDPAPYGVGDAHCQ